ncbi:MAG: M15 family metallopeptidase, partial [Brevundimonas sp.]
APSAPAVEGPLTSAGETPDVLAPLVAAAEAEQAPHTVDELVVPEVTGPEDRTTAELRAALDTIVELAGSVEDTAQARQDAADAAAAKRAAWEKSLQGYANGRIPASALCSPPFDSDALLRCDAADALEQLDKAYKAEFGTHIKLTDSYRSYAGQVSCRARKGSLCAVPGTSNHGTGVAVDFAGGIQTFGSRQHKWMVAHAAEFGWHHPAWAHAGGSKPEAWHWEYAA